MKELETSVVSDPQDRPGSRWGHGGLCGWCLITEIIRRSGGPPSGLTFISDSLHQLVELVHEHLLLTVHHGREAPLKRPAALSFISNAAPQIRRCILAHQSEEFWDILEKGKQSYGVFAALTRNKDADSLWRKSRIWSNGLKPHRPWKRVRAMAISGLWLLSG